MEWKVTSVGSSIRFRLLIKTHLSFLPHVVLMLLGDCGVWRIDQLELIINLLFFFPSLPFFLFSKIGSTMGIRALFHRSGLSNFIFGGRWFVL